MWCPPKAILGVALISDVSFWCRFEKNIVNHRTVTPVHAKSRTETEKSASEQRNILLTYVTFRFAQYVILLNKRPLYFNPAVC